MNAKKAALKGKIPGEFKKKKAAGKLPPKNTPYTSLSPSDIKELLTTTKDFVFDLIPPLFQLDNDSFLTDSGFHDAKELDLSGNSITKFVNGSHLSKLKYLSIENNGLVEINFTGLKNLVSLSVARNRIQTLNDMSDLSKLVYLDLSHNRIMSGWNQLQKLKGLKVLDLSNCRIDLPAAECNSLLLVHIKSLTKLQFLCLAGNPVENSIPDFKYFIIQELLELKYYNWDLITKEDRVHAAKLASSGKWKELSSLPMTTVIKKPPGRGGIRSDGSRQGGIVRRTTAPAQSSSPVNTHSPIEDTGQGEDYSEDTNDQQLDSEVLDDILDEVVAAEDIIDPEESKILTMADVDTLVDDLDPTTPSHSSTSSIPTEMPSLLETNIDDIDAWLETAIKDSTNTTHVPTTVTPTPPLAFHPLPVGYRASMDFEQKLNVILVSSGLDISEPTPPVPQHQNTLPTTEFITLFPSTSHESKEPTTDDAMESSAGKRILLGRYRRTPATTGRAPEPGDDILDGILAALPEDVLSDSMQPDQISANVDMLFPPISTPTSLPQNTSSTSPNTTEVDSLLQGLLMDIGEEEAAKEKKESLPPSRPVPPPPVKPMEPHPSPLPPKQHHSHPELGASQGKLPSNKIVSVIATQAVQAISVLRTTPSVLGIREIPNDKKSELEQVFAARAAKEVTSAPSHETTAQTKEPLSELEKVLMARANKETSHVTTPNKEIMNDMEKVNVTRATKEVTLKVPSTPNVSPSPPPSPSPSPSPPDDLPTTAKTPSNSKINTNIPNDEIISPSTKAISTSKITPTDSIDETPLSSKMTPTNSTDEVPPTTNKPVKHLSGQLDEIAKPSTPKINTSDEIPIAVAKTSPPKINNTNNNNIPDDIAKPPSSTSLPEVTSKPIAIEDIPPTVTKVPSTSNIDVSKVITTNSGVHIDHEPPPTTKVLSTPSKMTTNNSGNFDEISPITKSSKLITTNNTVHVDDITPSTKSKMTTTNNSGHTDDVSSLSTASPSIIHSVPLKDHDPWDIKHGEFTLESVMPKKGTFGISYLGSWNRSPDKIVIKKLHPTQPLEPNTDIHTDRIKFQEEVKRMIQLKHPNLGRVIGASVTNDKYVFYEYFEFGMDLHTYILEHTQYSSTFILQVARALASCIAYLHQEGVIHGAIKSRNIIIDKENKIHVLDYGFMDTKDCIPLEEADPQYLAPELFCVKVYREKIDVYSFAMVLYELISGKQPFQGIPANKVCYLVVERRRPQLPPGTPELIASLIQKCWTADPPSRPTFPIIKQVLSRSDSILPPDLIYPLRVSSASILPTPTTNTVTSSTPINSMTSNNNPVTSPASVPTISSVLTPPTPIQDTPTSARPTNTLPSSSQKQTLSSTLPKPPHKPEVQILTPPFVHSTFMSGDDISTISILLDRLKAMINSPVTAHQIKAINALIQVACTPGRILYVAQNDAIIQCLCSLLGLAGQIGKFELVEHTLTAIMDLGVYPIMAEHMSLPQNRTLTSLISILSNEDASLVNKAAKALQVLAIAYPPCADAMRVAGALPRLVGLLKINNINIQTAALVALMGFLISPTNVTTFLQTPGFIDLETLSRSRVAQLRLHAMEALTYFMGDPVRSKIEEMNLRDIFLKTLNLQHSVIKEVGLRSLNKMLELAPDSLTDIEKTQLLSETIRVLSSEPHLSQIIPACSIILFLLKADENIGNERNLALFHNSAGIGAILGHLESSVDNVRLQVLQILYLTQDYEESRKSFVTMGGVASLTNSLNHWDTRIRQITLKCLSKIIPDLSCNVLVQMDIIPYIASILGYISDNVEIALAADIVCEILQLDDDEHNSKTILFKMMRDNAVMESLLHLWGTNPRESTLESVVYAISVLSQKDFFRELLVQDDAFKIIKSNMNHISKSIQERIAWMLANIASMDYGCYLIATTCLRELLELLASESAQVVSSTLKTVLCVSRKTIYMVYFKDCDPDLTKLKALQNHPLPNIQGVANKLVQILEAKI